MVIRDLALGLREYPSFPLLIAHHLQPAAVIMPASSSGRSVAPAQPAAVGDERPVWDPARPLPVDALAWNLERGLPRLRPDPRGRAQTRIWVATHELPDGGLFEGGDMRLELWRGHPLVARALAEPSASNLAWLLLGIYAHTNAATGVVTNRREAHFQLIVGEALLDGRLQVLEPFSSDHQPAGPGGHGLETAS